MLQSINPESIAAWLTAIATAYGLWRVVKPKLRAKIREAIGSAVTVHVTTPIMTCVDDRMAQVNGSLDALGGTTRAIQQDVKLLTDVTRGHLGLESDGRFEANANGAFVWVSPSYLRWIGRSESQMIGWGWVSMVTDSERDEVLRDYLSAIKFAREFRRTVTFTHDLGHRLRATMLAVPVLDGDGDCQRYAGIVQPLTEGEK